MVCVAQLVERSTVTRKVAGSSPVTHPDRFQFREQEVIAYAGTAKCSK